MPKTFNKRTGIVYSTPMDSWTDSVNRLLVATQLADELTEFSCILIKPNLVEALAPPITTPVGLIESLVVFLQQTVPDVRIVIGEGTGSIHYKTHHCFEMLGYTEMAMRRGIELLDLNGLELVRKEQQDCSRWPEMYLPELLDRVFLLSVPVLKAHSLAGVTLTMKNMMGCAPPAHYQHGGSWGKSAFHTQIHEAISELNRYRCPDFTLLDASIGMSKAHLWGPHCEPPVGLLVASYDPVAIDSYGCSLLKKDWHSIGHISMAHKKLGYAKPLEIHEI